MPAHATAEEVKTALESIDTIGEVSVHAVEYGSDELEQGLGFYRAWVVEFGASGGAFPALHGPLPLMAARWSDSTLEFNFQG